MRDGIRLYADIYRPDDGRRHPVLLLRTPYNKEDAQTMNYAHPSWYARHGYVVIVQDTRGRWVSEGDFQPYADDGQDGYDTIEWAASLPYTVPKVGMYGFSYAGAVQWLAAANRPPHLTCTGWILQVHCFRHMIEIQIATAADLPGFGCLSCANKSKGGVKKNARFLCLVRSRLYACVPGKRNRIPPVFAGARHRYRFGKH
ncbi:CocE/NonD family hydrolase [Paenibacillus naphthalenovorans]|uniref:CocE/NonD family hydrolase n=1 Tax=Paenibacillus naphthalenovorans TaxID=162209 RepID=UPI001F3907FF|nr:CocE/NonD family hydrolase [Paenibacillus naphthalenovorans]